MISVLLSSSIFILFRANFIEFDETSTNCNPDKIIILKEKFNIFTGYSEERITKYSYEIYEDFMFIPPKHFEDSDIIRFKVMGWQKKPFIYKSKFFIDNYPCDVHDEKVILKFYINVLILMNKDRSFNKDLLNTCSDIIYKMSCDSKHFGRRKRIMKILLDIYHLKIKFKGSDFDLFKLICVTLMKKVNSEKDLEEELDQFNNKQKNEIYNLSRTLIEAMQQVNFYLLHVNIMKSFSLKETLLEFIKE